jgi:hypothetical protein
MPIRLEASEMGRWIEYAARRRYSTQSRTGLDLKSVVVFIFLEEYFPAIELYHFREGRIVKRSMLDELASHIKYHKSPVFDPNG